MGRRGVRRGLQPRAVLAESPGAGETAARREVDHGADAPNSGRVDVCHGELLVVPEAAQGAPPTTLATASGV